MPNYIVGGVVWTPNDSWLGRTVIIMAFIDYCFDFACAGISCCCASVSPDDLTRLLLSVRV